MGAFELQAAFEYSRLHRQELSAPLYNRRCVVCGNFFPCYHNLVVRCSRCR